MELKPLTLNNLEEVYMFFSKHLARTFNEYQNIAEYMLSSDRWLSKKSFHYTLESSLNICLGLYDQSNLVGYLEGELPQFDKAVCLNWLVILPEYQHQGLGSFLIQRYEDMIQKEEGHTIYIYAHDKVVDFYKKQNYHSTGRVEKLWFDLPYNFLVKEMN